uniref:Uncharacterized protein n=1 Tax=Panagrolaimus sp. PS1159 TaxID=55785 RepID=A0AC35F244_9BILA
MNNASDIATGMNSVTFVSGNADKRNDAIAILSPHANIKLVDYDLKEIQGDEKEIAKEKLDLAMKIFENEIIIVEDTCKFFIWIDSRWQDYKDQGLGDVV